jgi:hypothetical protein
LFGESICIFKGGVVVLTAKSHDELDFKLESSIRGG